MDSLYNLLGGKPAQPRQPPSPPRKRRNIFSFPNTPEMATPRRDGGVPSIAYTRTSSRHAPSGSTSSEDSLPSSYALSSQRHSIREAPRVMPDSTERMAAPTPARWFSSREKSSPLKSVTSCPKAPSKAPLSTESLLRKPAGFCTGCRKLHPPSEFAVWQKPPIGYPKLCIGREGSFSLCRHKTVTFQNIEEALPPVLTAKDTVILRCEDESHQKGSEHHIAASRRTNRDLMMPQVTACIEDGVVTITTYFEELVCVVPRDQPLTAEALRWELDVLQASSTNKLCGHTALNSDRLVDLAGAIDCRRLRDPAHAGAHDTTCALSFPRYCAGGRPAGDDGDGAERGGYCNMKDSIGFCDKCEDTWFGFRRWRGSPDAAFHEIWLFGLSYMAFQGGFKPDCYAWRRRLD